MATHMLEGGADIRHIQEILGHAEMSTTAIYTRVSIRHLKVVHEATHPAARRPAAADKPDLARTVSSEGATSEADPFSSLAAEAADEEAAGDGHAEAG